MIRTTRKEKSLPVLIKELDDVFSKWIRKRDTVDGKIPCFICGKKMTFAEAQNMHYLNRDCMPLRYDERNCHAGCMECNCLDPGHRGKYLMAMIAKYGVAVVNELVTKSRSLQKFTRPELTEMIEFYKSENHLKKQS